MHVSYTELRQNLTHYLDEAVSSGAPLTITRQGKKGNVILISEEEFAGWQETVHLLSNPVNAEWLLSSIAEADAGKVTKRDLYYPPKSTAKSKKK